MKIYTRAKAFSNHPIQRYCFDVTGKQIRVYDPIAGYFTVCHALSKAAEKRILKLAKELSEAGLYRWTQ
jgi:hypothetical protein